jgi:hypothetical protein
MGGPLYALECLTMPALPLLPGALLPTGEASVAPLNPLSAEHHEYLEILGMPVSAQASHTELRAVLLRAQAAVEGMEHSMLTPLGLDMLAEIRGRLG